jgi:hypothetical protein
MLKKNSNYLIFNILDIIYYEIQSEKLIDKKVMQIDEIFLNTCYFILNNSTLTHVNILKIQIAIFLVGNIICNKISYF